MKTYEIMIIYNPQLSDLQIKEAVEKSKKIISSAKAEVLMEDSLGRKKFSHPIKKYKDGFYYYLKVKSYPENIKEINYNIKVQENVLRVSIILADKKETIKKI
jgi:ribosomal protein S6